MLSLVNVGKSRVFGRKLHVHLFVSVSPSFKQRGVKERCMVTIQHCIGKKFFSKQGRVLTWQQGMNFAGNGIPDL